MKILEFITKNSLAPVGGPYGYLYGLYQTDIKNENMLSFLDYGNPKANKFQKGSKDTIKAALVQKARYIKILFIGRRSVEIESNEYDIIHFHTTIDLFNCRRSLKRFNGKVVLTSHSPTLASIEMFDAAKKWEKIVFYPLYKMLKIMDTNAFKLADYIIFPCEEAEEPYSHAWKGFDKFKQNNIQKFKYLLSGTYKRKAQKAKEEIREEFGIPHDSFVISYVGRHNKIKGFDKLKIIGEKLLNMYPNVYFLIAGKEEPLKGLSHKRWVEVGWTNDPHSYIAASDLFILPNKETYFDLVMLEVLSLRKIVVASNTGGNKFFKNDKYKGVFIYDSIDDAVKEIESIMTLSSNEREELEQFNQDVFDKEFESEVFYYNYINKMKEIYNEE